MLVLLELESQMGISPHMGPGNQIYDLWKSTQCSQSLDFSPFIDLKNLDAQSANSIFLGWYVIFVHSFCPCVNLAGMV